jgi:hypothetical protein
LRGAFFNHLEVVPGQVPDERPLCIGHAGIDFDVIDFDFEGGRRLRRSRRRRLLRLAVERQCRKPDKNGENPRWPLAASRSDYTGRGVYKLNNYTKTFVVLEVRRTACILNRWRCQFPRCSRR